MRVLALALVAVPALLLGQGGPVRPLQHRPSRRVHALALLNGVPTLTADAHAAGLIVVPDTVRARRSAPDAATTLTAVMRQAIEAHRGDALFTDNPDVFPR